MEIANIGAILASTTQIGGDALENAVARLYLIKHVADFDRVDLNTPVGAPLDLGPGYPAYVQKAATANSRPRVDMLMWRGEVPTIVEVKGRITSSALGQVLAYWHVMKKFDPQMLNIYRVCIGQTIQDGLASIFDEYGVQIELFPEAAVSQP